MKNFIYRSITSVILVSIFILSIIQADYYFKLFLITIYLLGLIEIFNIKNLQIKIIIFIFLTFFLYSLYSLRTHYNGIFLILWCALLTWITDTGAYIFGKLFGKKKIKFISPNKTYVGFFSGVLLSQFSYFLLNVFIQNINFFTLKKIILIQMSTAFVTIIGDLFFSFLKRKISIKDFSQIIPGHGGLFDRIDGLIFSIIFFNLLFNL